MPDHLHEYIVELSRELRSFPADEAREILAESELHLRDRIAALEELGVPAQEAEIEAVAAFGDPKRLARSLRSNSNAASQIGFVAACATVLGLACWPLTSESRNMLWAYLPFILAVGVAATGYRTKQLALGRLFAVAVAGTFLLCFIAGSMYVSLGPEGGFGFVSRFDAPQMEAVTRNAKEGKAAIVQAAIQRMAIVRAQDPVAEAKSLGLFKGGEILVPQYVNRFHPQGFGEIVYKSVPSDIAIQMYWNDVPRDLQNASQNVEWFLADGIAFRNALNRPWLTEFGYCAPGAMETGALWFMLMALLNLGGVLIRKSVDAVKARGWVRA